MSNKQIQPHSHEPIRSQLRAILRNEISEGKFLPGGRIPSERELAARFHISRTSVRETITELINSGVLFRTVGKGTFVSQSAVRRPNFEVSAVSFVISEDIFNFVQTGYNKILAGAQHVCRNRETQLLFHPMRDDSIPYSLAIDGDVSQRVSGAIVVGGVKRHVIDRLQEEGIPIVLVDTILDDEARDFPSVAIDYATGARMAVDYLHNCGHRKIGYIGFSGSKKYESYWSALEELGLPYDPRQVVFLQLLDLEPGIFAGFRAMQRILSRRSVPSAMIVTNDFVVIGVLEALGMAGIRVPEHMSVIGFDDLGVKQSPPLTTVRVNLTKVGEEAARMLFEQIESAAGHPKNTLIPVKLIVRGSTGQNAERTADRLQHLPARDHVREKIPEAPAGRSLSDRRQP